MIPSYREFVQAHVYHNPCLSGLASFLKTPYKPFEDATIRCLDFSEECIRIHGKEPTLEECFEDISSALDQPNEKYLRRIILIENIDPSTVERLGIALDIDPLFFATYISTSFTGIDQGPPPPSIALFPTSSTSNDSLHLHYQRVIRLPLLGNSFPYEFKSSSNAPRSVRRLAPLSDTQPGLVRSCCSILSRTLNDRSWICKSIPAVVFCTTF
jgi:hypothetical protein